MSDRKPAEEKEGNNLGYWHIGAAPLSDRVPEELTMDHKAFNFWVMIRPARDLPGVWVSHCLDLDVVSQGDSLRDAYDSVIEASLMTLADDLTEKRDITERRAPKEFWDELFKLANRAKRVDFKETVENPPKDLSVLCAQVVVSVQIQPLPEGHPAPADAVEVEFDEAEYGERPKLVMHEGVSQAAPDEGASWDAPLAFSSDRDRELSFA